MRPVSINGIEFDALMSEDKEMTADVPEYPVESGYSVSDNIARKPMTLAFVLHVTKTPVTWLGRHGTGRGHVLDVCAELERLFWAGELVTVVTDDNVYNDMSIISLKIPKDTENYTDRDINISLKQIITVSAETTEIPDSYGRGGKTKENMGTVNTSGNGSVKDSGNGSSSGAAGTGSGDGKKGSILYNVFFGGKD